MARRDWLVLLLAYKSANGTALDPVRIQKGMFLLGQQGHLGEGESYPFEPYHYGPYSFAVKDDLDQLVHEGLVETIPVPGYTWSRFQLTSAGMRHAHVVNDGAPPETTCRVYEVKQEISRLSFNELLGRVYDRYPEYATKSVFSG